jgi:hypothetical protein
MVDVYTFLTTLYVIADDFCHSRPPKRTALVLPTRCADLIELLPFRHGGSHEHHLLSLLPSLNPKAGSGTTITCQSSSMLLLRAYSPLLLCSSLNPRAAWSRYSHPPVSLSKGPPF